MTIFVKRVEESPIEGRMMDTGLFRWSDREECPLLFLVLRLTIIFMLSRFVELCWTSKRTLWSYVLLTSTFTHFSCSHHYSLDHVFRFIDTYSDAQIGGSAPLFLVVMLRLIICSIFYILLVDDPNLTTVLKKGFPDLSLKAPELSSKF